MPLHAHGRAWIELLALAAVPGCSFGVGMQRLGEHTLVESLGDNRYTYTTTVIGRAHERVATPPQLVLTPPPGAREVAQIWVRVEFSGWGARGLRAERAEFFPVLATLAEEVGGSHLVVSQTERVAGAWISLLVADVYAEP
jgi:hypothetical protein